MYAMVEQLLTDHFTQFMDINLKFVSEKPQRNEIFNFKEKEAQMKFKRLTTETDAFTKCFLDETSILSQIKKWRETLAQFCKHSFKKIRIRKKNIKPLKKHISNLIDERNKLVSELGQSNKKRIDEISNEIAEDEAKENRDVIVNNFKALSKDTENINLQQMWKLCKKLWPKKGETLPTAKRNHKGKIVTGPREIKKLLAKEYKDRLRTRPVRPDLRGMRKRKKTIFKMKMKLAKSNPSIEWKMEDLDQALRDLKNNKSRDFERYINEIFKPGTIGSDLKKSFC